MIVLLSQGRSCILPGEVVMSELFDARRVMLTDDGVPPCDRRVVSLVSALRAVLQPPELALVGEGRARA